MRNGEGGTVPSYNVQLVTDSAQGLVVNVEATPTPSITINSRRRWHAVSKRWDTFPAVVPMATTPITPRSRRRRIAAWTFMDRGRKVGSPANAMPKAAALRFWPARSPIRPSPTASLAGGKNPDSPGDTESRARVRVHVYHAPQEACRNCVLRSQCAPPNARPAWSGRFHAWKSQRRPWPSRPRWPPKKPSRFTANAPASPSFPTPGLRNAAPAPVPLSRPPQSHPGGNWAA